MNVPLSTLQMFFAVLLCGLLIPQFGFFASFHPIASRLPRWIVPGSTLLVGAILLSSLSRMASSSESRSMMLFIDRPIYIKGEDGKWANNISARL